MACTSSIFCVQSDLYLYDDQYLFAGTHNGEDYFTGSTVPFLIYYSTTENRWCLSNVLDGSCLQFGPTNSTNSCPDLDESFFYSGICVTTTTTTSPCETFDFEAIFDCMVPTTTTTTTTIPPTTTTTTTIFNPCSTVSVLATIVSYTTTTTTVLPTTTTTTTILRPCNFDGNVQFNIFDEYMKCGNSKVFRDCLTGIDFYTSDILLTEFGTLPIQGYVYKANVNGVSACITFLGLVDTTSGVDTIQLIDEIGPENENGCLLCLPDPPPTSTTTTSTSTTTTTTKKPCIISEYLITNNFKNPQEFTYFDCDGNKFNGIVDRFSNKKVCSSITPLVYSNFVVVSDTGFVCE